MTTIRISYDPDLSKIGTIQDVPADEARLLVRRGRATYVNAEQPPAAIVPAEAALAEAVARVGAAQDELNDTLTEDADTGTSLDLDED